MAAIRRVKVFKMVKEQGDNHCYKMIKTVDYEANFHKFGVNFEELETGAGNYSTAIVEKEDGQIENVPVEMIRFIKVKGK